jgi:DNA-binding MarR family transcriptional regulator
MNKPSPGMQTDEFLDFLIVLMRYRLRMMTLLPEELLQQKECLQKLHLHDGSRRTPDKDLFFRVGMTLSRHGKPLPMGELSKALDVPLSTATRIVDGLVENGYAERVADPEDRRVVRVALTEQGRALFQVIHSYLQRGVDEILSQFTSEERDQLLFLLRKAARIMDERSK